LDNLSKEKRSKIMAAIHSKNTKPELILRNALYAKGIEFETYYSSEKIDIAFPIKKMAVFVDGCFWHGCPVHSHKIGTNETYWQPKLQKNIERDKRKTEKLKKQGWTVLRFWEHELIDKDKVVNKIQKTLQEKKLSS
jgi:DNA mismatch endonuclease (patch repair protein)